MNQSRMLENLLELARSSCGGTVAEIVILEEPEFRINSTTDSAGIRADGGGLGIQAGWLTTPELFSDAKASGRFAPWVGSIALVPLTGPSGGEGWIAVAHPEQGSLDASALSNIERVATLVEDRLDRTIEKKRLDELGAVLRDSQEALRETSSRLEISNRELEQFAYIAAHELVAPLRAVAVYAEVLENLISEDGANVPSQSTSCVSEIRSGVALMNQQVQYLLQLSTMADDTTDLEAVDLGDVVRAALDTLAEPLAEVQAKVTVDALPVVQARPVPLQSVIANLVANAVRYRDPERTLQIHISSECASGGDRILVADNGAGVDDADQGRIFELFERASTAASGSGIGLAVSRRIVETFRGSMGVKQADPHGSIFWVEFPPSAQ